MPLNVKSYLGAQAAQRGAGGSERAARAEEGAHQKRGSGACVRVCVYKRVRGRPGRTSRACC
jgi:hypothetical protein